MLLSLPIVFGWHCLDELCLCISWFVLCCVVFVNVDFVKINNFSRPHHVLLYLIRLLYD